MKSLCNTFFSLLDDFKRLMPDVKGFDRDFVTIDSRIKNEGVSFATLTLPRLGAEIDLSLSQGRWTSPMGFSHPKGSSLPRFLSGLTCLVFDKNGLLLEKPSAEAVKALRELTFLCKKFTLSSDQENILDRQAKDEFHRCDNSVSICSDTRLYHLSRVSTLCLRDLDRGLEDIECKHGPGEVSEKITANQKWNAVGQGLMRRDPLLQVSHPSDLFQFGSLVNVGQPSDIALRDTARLISVKKNSSSRRTITIEPVLKQYVQQGLNTHLRERIERDKVLRNCLALSDQSKNQQLALIGSITGEYATIDLSSASDRLGLRLFDACFGHNPAFAGLARLCRSNRVDSSTSDMNKFAGMGNALTFPVQSVIFSLIAICAILDSKGFTPTERNVRRVSHSVRVYGDDIIIPNEHYCQVVEWLESLGLKVNQRKSFHTGNFRESCGVDAFMGYNVTPKYLRHEPSFTSNSPEAINGLVSFSNQCWSEGLYSLATFIQRAVEKSIRFRLPNVRSTSGALGWTNRREAYDFQKWDRNLHKFLVRSLVTKPKQRLDHLDGYPALLKFFHVPLIGRGVGHLERSSYRYRTTHRMRWVQAS